MTKKRHMGGGCLLRKVPLLEEDNNKGVEQEGGLTEESRSVVNVLSDVCVRGESVVHVVCVVRCGAAAAAGRRSLLKAHTGVARAAALQSLAFWRARERGRARTGHQISERT